MLKFCDRVPMVHMCTTDMLSREGQTEGIKESVETVIFIEKDAGGLGLEVVGGSDTYLGGVVVMRIVPGGATAKDGRLTVGDQILMVNDVSLQKISHKDAVSSLRMATSPVKLVVLREDPQKIFTTADEPTKFFDVKLVKPISGYLGLSILARRDGKGVFVTYVTEDSIAYREGTIRQGDKILEVNGTNLSKATQEDACHVLRRAYGSVKLKIGRISSLQSSLCAFRTKASYVNHALEDDRVPSREFRRWNSFGFEPKRKQKVSRDINNAPIENRRRSMSCRDYGPSQDVAVESGWEEMERASPRNGTKRSSHSQPDVRDYQPRERFRYIHPDRYELSFQQTSNETAYQREDYV